ncbi:MAG: hypothetical protein EZS28_042777, partial [Streblomastix strix]
FGDSASTIDWVEMIGRKRGEARVSYGDNYKSSPNVDYCSPSPSVILESPLYFEIIQVACFLP